MAGEGSSNPKFFESFKQYVKADGRDLWEPEKYARLLVYVTIYNYIKQNLQDFAPQNVDGVMQPSRYGIDFGLKSSALSTQINDTIRNHLDWFIEHLKINKPVADGGVDINLNKNQFLTEMDGYIQECNEMVSSGTLPNHPKDAEGNSEPLTTEEALVLLRAKEEKTREWFDHVRNSVEGKPFDLDKEGKPVGGYRTIAVTKVEMQRKQILADIATNSGNILFRTLVTAGGAGLTLASGLSLLSYAGVAVGSVGGALFAASPVGLAIASAVGLVVGVKVTKHAVLKLLNAIGRQGSLIKEHFEFMNGIGKYKPDENNRPRGYRAVLADYDKAQYMKKIFIGFKTPDRAEDFEKEFNKYFEEALKKYESHFSKADLKFIRGKKEKVKFAIQVSDGEKYRIDSKGRTVKCGASTFGRARALANRNIAINREDYKLTNINELDRMIKANIEACKTVEDLNRDLKFLSQNKPAFTNINREYIYNSYEEQYAEKAIDAINYTAFEQPLTINTVQDLIDTLENPKIAEIVKSGGFADKTKDFKSVQRFIENENLDGAASVNLHASLNDQINITKAAMISAITSEGFGSDRVAAGTPEYAAAEAVIDKINSFNEYDSAVESSILSEIDALPSPLDRTHEYLKFMFEKKINESVYSKDTIQNIVKSSATGTYAETPFVYKDVIAYCEGFGKDGIRSGDSSTSELYSRLSNIVSEMTSGAAIDAVKYNSIKSDIEDAFGGRPKLENYLLYVLDSQAGKISSSVDKFASEISNLKYSDLRTDYPSQLMSTIMSSNMPPKSKLAATKALERQLGSLKNRRNNESKVYMMEVLKEGSFDDFEEYSTKIKAFTTLQDLESEETHKFYEETILKIGDEKIRNYFIALFETNAKRVISTQIEKDIRENKYSGTEGLSNLTKFFTTIKGYKYFDDLQKDEFIGDLSGFITTSFETILKEYYEHFILKSGEINNIADYKRKAFSEGGLKEYLYGNSSTESKNLKMQLDNVTNNIKQLVDYMTGVANGQNITEDNGTTLVVGRIFFDKLDRNSDDDLKKSLSSTKSTVSSNISTLSNGEPDSSNVLIRALNLQIANAINTFTGTPLVDITTIDYNSRFNFDDINYDIYLKGKSRQAKDLLAALLAIKRHMMICYKQHLNMFLQKQMGYTPTTKQSEIVDNLSGKVTSAPTASGSRPPRVYGNEFEKIKSNWQVIFENIDRICEELSDKIKEVDPKTFDGTLYKKAMDLITLTEPTKAISVATEPVLENF